MSDRGRKSEAGCQKLRCTECGEFLKFKNCTPPDERFCADCEFNDQGRCEIARPGDEICWRCWDKAVFLANAERIKKISEGWVADETGAIHPPEEKP